MEKEKEWGFDIHELEKMMYEEYPKNMGGLSAQCLFLCTLILWDLVYFKIINWLSVFKDFEQHELDVMTSHTGDEGEGEGEDEDEIWDEHDDREWWRWYRRFMWFTSYFKYLLLILNICYGC